MTRRKKSFDSGDSSSSESVYYFSSNAKRRYWQKKNCFNSGYLFENPAGKESNRRYVYYPKLEESEMLQTEDSNVCTCHSCSKNKNSVHGKKLKSVFSRVTYPDEPTNNASQFENNSYFTSNENRDISRSSEELQSSPAHHIVTVHVQDRKEPQEEELGCSKVSPRCNTGVSQQKAELYAKPPVTIKIQSHPLQGEGDYLSDDTESDLESITKSKSIKNKMESLQPEISLTKMGFSEDWTIDWAKVELPVKTDLHKLLHYRISNYLNPDMHIKIGKHEYRCHSLVLQCYSTYFNDKPSQIEIPENCVTKTAFMCIYDWMLHLGHDSYQLLRRDNILEVFMAAQYLGIKELEKQCWAFIDNEDLFSEDKAFMMYLEAKKHGNAAIMELMIPRIQNFFLTLVSSKDFVNLVLEEVCVFLKSNYICIHGEIEVFMSAVRWLMYDWEERSKHLVEIMRCVRFGLIAPWQLVDIRRNPESEEFILITNSLEVSKMIEEGLAFAIIKYWYGHQSSDYYHWIESLCLTEPASRNWIGTEKTYLCYRDFLASLDNCRRKQKLVKKRSKYAAEIQDTSTEKSTNNEASESTPELPPPPPVPSSVPTMARPQLNTIKQINRTDVALDKPNNKFLSQLGYNETRLLKRMIEEQERLDREHKNDNNKYRIQDLWKKMKNIENLNAKNDSDIKEEINIKDKTKTKPDRKNNYVNLREKSAVTIQSAFRGYKARKLYQELKRKNRSNSKPAFQSKPVSTLYSSVKSSSGKKYTNVDTLFFPDEEAVLVFGGMNPHESYSERTNSAKNIYRYLPKCNTWEFVGEMPEPLHHHSAAFYKGKVIIAGGKTPEQVYENSDAVTRTVWCFDPATRGWSHMPSLLHPRTNFGFVTCRGKLYAIGGQDHSNRFLKSVEMYDTQTGHWSFVDSLHTGRAGLAAAKFKDQIWVAGGVVEVKNNISICTSSVETYDCSQNVWCSIEDLRYPICYSVLFPTNDKLYLIGGCIGDHNNHVFESISTIDIWDPYSKKWGFKTQMKVPRHAHSVCYRDTQILIIGGVSSVMLRALGSIECWDMQKGVWLKNKARLPSMLSGHNAVALPPASLL